MAVRIGRRRMLAMTLAIVAPSPLSATERKIYRVAILAQGSPAASQGGEYLEIWKKALRDLGYIEGQNIAFEARWSDNKVERLDGLAVELVALKPDVIFAPLTTSARAARRATSTIPIVTASVANPVESGLAASLARPGGNVTGVANLQADLSPKWVQLILECVPKATRVGLLVAPGASADMLSNLRSAASDAGLTVLPLVVGSEEDLAGAFASMARERASAFIVAGGAFLYSHASTLVDMAAKAKLPGVYPYRHYAEKGGLFSYGVDLDNQFRLAAGYVDKILKGAKAAEMPMQQPIAFELVVNLKTARTLGIVIPQSVLLKADKIIE